MKLSIEEILMQIAMLAEQNGMSVLDIKIDQASFMQLHAEVKVHAMRGGFCPWVIMATPMGSLKIKCPKIKKQKIIK